MKSFSFCPCKSVNLFSSILLAGIVAFLFHGALGNFWRMDDPYILLHALQSPGLSAFVDPEDWRRLSPANLTPWVTLSFKLDLWLAGLSPAFFYAHQLFSLTMTTIAFYVLARHMMPWHWALAACLLFLVGAPTASVAEQLMTRHYLEGLGFALFSMAAFLAAERERRFLWALVGATLYALAATAKETYVPLPLVLLCLPLRTPISEANRPTANACHEFFSAAGWRERVRNLAPYACVTLCYVGWRHYMLGSFLGGYLATGMTGLGLSVDEANFSVFAVLVATKAQLAFATFAHLPELLFGHQWVLPTVIFCCSTGFFLIQCPAWIPSALALVICLFAPLLPLSVYPGIHAPDRYVFLLWCVISLTGVLAIRTLAGALPERPFRAFRPLAECMLFMALFSAAAMYQMAFYNAQKAMFRALDAQSRFIMDRDKTTCLTPTRSLELIALLCAYVRQGAASCPQSVFPDVPLERPCQRLFVYDTQANKMAEISRRPTNFMSTVVDTARPLQVRLFFQDSLFHWSMGPYSEGQYYLASSTLGRIGLPGSAGNLPAAYNYLSVHVLYESPEGWKTISPRLSVSRETPLVWERRASPHEP